MPLVINLTSENTRLNICAINNEIGAFNVELRNSFEFLKIILF